MLLNRTKVINYFFRLHDAKNNNNNNLIILVNSSANKI